MLTLSHSGYTLGILSAMIFELRKPCEGQKGCACVVHVDEVVLASFGRVWYDTMKSLRVVCRTSTADALRIWGSLGTLLGLREGVDPVTLQKPSTPSTQPYWRILKRCFWKPCCCATPFPPQVHKMHVCRGCWRVLYCSRRCQKM